MSRDYNSHEDGDGFNAFFMAILIVAILVVIGAIFGLCLRGAKYLFT